VLIAALSAAAGGEGLTSAVIMRVALLPRSKRVIVSLLFCVEDHCD